MSTDLTPRQQQVRAQKAHKVEQRIKHSINLIRRQWTTLAADLYEFVEMRGWEALGYSSQESWLADPEIDLSRTRVYRLLEVHRDLVVGHGVDVERLAAIDRSKVWEVLPAVRRKQVEVDVALADCESLGQTDLREKYRAIRPTSTTDVNDEPIKPDDFHYEKCEACGQTRKVYDR